MRVGEGPFCVKALCLQALTVSMVIKYRSDFYDLFDIC